MASKSGVSLCSAPFGCQNLGLRAVRSGRLCGLLRLLSGVSHFSIPQEGPSNKTGMVGAVVSFPFHPGLLKRCHKYISLSRSFHIAVKTNTVRFETSHIVREKPQERFSGSSTSPRHSLIPESSQQIKLENSREHSLQSVVPTITRRLPNRLKRGLDSG